MDITEALNCKLLIHCRYISDGIESETVITITENVKDKAFRAILSGMNMTDNDLRAMNISNQLIQVWLTRGSISISRLNALAKDNKRKISFELRKKIH